MSTLESQNELLSSIQKIKDYIDNVSIELKVELPYIYYKSVSNNAWNVLIDLNSIYKTNNQLHEMKQIEMVKRCYGIGWKYTDESNNRVRPLLLYRDLKGSKGEPGEAGQDGVTFIPYYDEETNQIKFTNNGGLTNPDPIQLNGTFDINNEINDLLTESKLIIGAINELKEKLDDINEKLNELTEESEPEEEPPSNPEPDPEPDPKPEPDFKYVALNYTHKELNDILAKSVMLSNFISIPSEENIRPNKPIKGQCFFDTDLNKPIWFDGSNWIDSNGTIID